MKKVVQFKIDKGMKVSELIDRFLSSGVMGAGRVAKAASIMKKMFSDKNCTVFLGVAGAMVPGGLKNVIIDLLETGKVDVFVTTGANLTHDLVEALGYSHYQGSAQCDDIELNKKSIDRIYESYMPNEVYEGLEDFFKQHFSDIGEPRDITEFLWRIGSFVKAKDSILRVCYDKKIPVFCPAISDSGIGLMVWGRIAEGKKLTVDAFQDLRRIMSIAMDAKTAGVIYIGGGVPKNYIQQAMQLSPNAAKYGIQVTMDRPEPGGSSGAELREGISWGKMSADGEYVDVICDATIALPLIYAAVKDSLARI
ncbi:MAG: deoxyhypusine synthase [Candidatus Woesearchaeota archaeon]